MPDDFVGDRLLVIDDEAALGLIIKRIAERAGYETVVTHDATVFLKAVRLWRPSVIMLDLIMPGMDGIQLLRALAAENYPAPIIVTSGVEGKILETAMQLGRERGLNMALPMSKPMHMDELRDRLQALKRPSKLQLCAELSNAVSAGQLLLEYQPKLDCGMARITGVEALVRWNHPTHGRVPPDSFIGLAEEMDIIGRITDSVIAEAAAQAARWRAGGLELDLAINISAHDLEDLDLPDRLAGHCRDAGVAPSTITLELTETGAMREASQMMDVLTRMRLKGFKLSIDDFGTGYSSLVQLQKLPFSELKVDRSFVGAMTANTGCRAIVEIVIDLARKLGLKSVAEGVEDAAAFESLINLRCDAAQGYHIAPPMPPERVPDIVRHWPAAPDTMLPAPIGGARQEAASASAR